MTYCFAVWKSSCIWSRFSRRTALWANWEISVRTSEQRDENHLEIENYRHLAARLPVSRCRSDQYAQCEYVNGYWYACRLHSPIYSECEHGRQWLVRSYMSNIPAVCMCFACRSVSGCREKGQMARMCWILICWEFFVCVCWCLGFDMRAICDFFFFFFWSLSVALLWRFLTMGTSRGSEG